MRTSFLLFVAFPFSPCSSTVESFARLLKQDASLPAGFVNDIYNCLGTEASTDDSVKCDVIALKWETTLLDPDRKPKRCAGFDPVNDDVTLSDDDYLDPCVHWYRLVSSLSETPSTVPSFTPSTLSPVSPSRKPTRKAPEIQPSRRPTKKPTKLRTQKPSPSPTFLIEELPVREVSHFILTVTLPLGRKRRLTQGRRLPSTSEELITITEEHLKTYLEDSLSLSIASIVLVSISSEYSTTYLMHDLEGRVYFYPDSVLPTPSTLNFLVQQAFHGLGLDEYLTLLRGTAKSKVLKNALYADVVAAEEEVQPQQPAMISFFGGFQWTTPWIVICVAGGVAALGIFIIIVLLYKSRAARNSPWRDDLEKQRSADTPTTHPEDIARFDDEDIQSNLNSDLESDTTSIYSYKQQDDASVSLAPSFLHAITERSALGAFYGGESDDDSLQTPSVMWSPPLGQQKKNEVGHCSRPKSVFVRSEEKSFHRSALANPPADQDDVDISHDWTYDGEYEGTASVAGDESVAGESHAVYLTDDEEAPREQFAHVWDDESKQADLTTFPVGDISLEQSEYSYT